MKKLRIGLEWFLNPDHLPLLIGMEKGWFEEVGLDIEMIEPTEHLDAVDALESGEMDLAITEPIHLVEDGARGKNVVGLARFLHTNGGVMYFGGSAIERPRDMAGVRIQYPGAPGPGGPAIVKTMIEADGGSCDVEDFTAVNNGFYHTNALIEDKADVATLVFYNFEVLEARHRGHKAHFFALKDWGIPDFCQLILIADSTRLEERRDDFVAFIKVLSRGIDFLHQNPQDAKEIYFRRTGSDSDSELVTAIFDATVRTFTYDFTMSNDYYEVLENWMADHRLIPPQDSPRTYWSNELLFD